jgi:hypothetical protein
MCLFSRTREMDESPSWRVLEERTSGGGSERGRALTRLCGSPLSLGLTKDDVGRFM